MARNHGAAGGTAESRNDNWETPPDIFAKLHGIFNFDIDAAASPHNAKLPKFWTKEDDALAQDWSGLRVFCNPPYSMKEALLEKAIAGAKAGGLSVILLPASTETDWYHKFGAQAEIWQLKSRIPYLLDGKRPQRWDDKKKKLVSSGNTKGSSLLIYWPHYTEHIIRLVDLGNFPDELIWLRDYAEGLLIKNMGVARKLQSEGARVTSFIPRVVGETLEFDLTFQPNKGD